MSISREQMFAGITVRDCDKVQTDWAVLSADWKWWIGGNHDGDGYVSLDVKHGLRVGVKKAQNGWTSLTRLQQLLGGHIYKCSDGTETQQATKTWTISGRTALKFCQEMALFTHLKKNQLNLAAQFPLDAMQAMHMRPVSATHQTDGTVRVFASTVIASAELGVNRGSMHRPLNKPSLTGGGYYWKYIENPVTVEETARQRNHIQTELARLKTVEHLSIDDKALPLNLAYVAGLVDSDGLIELQKNGTKRLSVSQKYDAICIALVKSFGGKYFQRKEEHLNDGGERLFVWRLGGSDGIKLLRRIAPFIVEKTDQVNLVLNIKPGQAKSMLPAFQRLKGWQKGQSAEARAKRCKA